MTTGMTTGMTAGMTTGMTTGMTAGMTAGMTIARLLQSATQVPCRPWPRHLLSPAAWSEMAAALAESTLVLLALWADTVQVHALLMDDADLTVLPVSTPVEAGVYPALSPARPAAALFERMILDLWGHVAQGSGAQGSGAQGSGAQGSGAQGSGDQRPWLDHGAWPHAKPMAVRPDPPRRPYEPPELPTCDDPRMLLPLGPVWGQLEEANRIRLILRGNTVVSAEGALGFTHKGTLALMRGKTPRNAARFASRLSGDATVAHSIAFAAAAEAALSVTPPPRAVALRAAMLEIERVAGHLDNLAEVGRLADSPQLWSECGYLRERLSRAASSAFGHRLMMDLVVPGGVALDIAEGGQQVVLRALGEIASALSALRRLHDGTALAVRLNGIGRTNLALAALTGVGGVAGRACGRPFDSRTLAEGRAGTPLSAARAGGDARARQHLRITEIGDSLRRIGAAFESLPPGPLTVALPQDSGEGIGWAESVRGDIWHWLRLDHGQIAACFPRDPGWALWPLAEQALAGASAWDVDLIRHSLALPASGMDL